VNTDEIAAKITANKKLREERIAEGKAAAPAGKEPFDLAAIKRTATTDALGKMSDDELRSRLEEIYYVDKPKLMTMAQLAPHVEELARWP
jgi:hypothetical protein